MTRCPVSAPLVLLLAAAAAGCGNPLMAKEDRERIEVVKQAVEREPSRINAADEHGWPPLHNAVINGYTDLLNWLLDRGADPNVAGPGGQTALHVAAIHDSTRDRTIIKTLIRRGADVNAPSDHGWTPLHVAAGFGRVATLEALLAGGARPLVRIHNGDTPLHLAATPQPTRSPADCRLVINLLVGHGADPNDQPAHGMTPLHRAALLGSEVAIRALIAAGARADAPGPGGATALHIAARSGSLPAVRALLDLGADVNHRDGDGRTPLSAVLERSVHDDPGGRRQPADVREVIAILRMRGGQGQPGAVTPPGAAGQRRDEAVATRRHASLHQAILYRDADDVARHLAAGADWTAPAPDGRPVAFHGVTAPVLRVLRGAGLALDTRASDATTFFAHYLNSRPDTAAQDLLDAGFSEEEIGRAVRVIPVPLRIDGSRSSVVPLRLFSSEPGLRIVARGFVLQLADLEPESLRYALGPGDPLAGVIPGPGTRIRVEGPEAEDRLEQRTTSRIQIDMRGPHYELDWREGVTQWQPLEQRGARAFEGIAQGQVMPGPYTMDELRDELLRRPDMAGVADLVGGAASAGRPDVRVGWVTTAVELRLSVRRGGAWVPVKTIALLPATGC